MLAVSPTVERWHQSIAALVEHREQCTRCRPGKGDRRSQHSVLQGKATRIGVTLEEYVRRMENGERWCGHHKRWELSAGFLKRKSSPDGFASECKETLRERARARKDGAA